MDAIDLSVPARPSDVPGTPGLPEDLTTTSRSIQINPAAPQDDDDSSETIPVMFEEPPTTQEHLGRLWRHTKVLLRLFPRDGGNEQVVLDPFVFRVYFGAHLKPIDIFSDDLFSIPSFQNVHVIFNEMNGALSESESAEYSTRQTYVQVRLSNCCRTVQKRHRLRSFELHFPQHLLPNVRIQINQCDHIVLEFFDPLTFAYVTSLTLSETFLRFNESWTIEMLQYFKNTPAGNFRELSLPLPIYLSTSVVTAITGFLRWKGPQVTVTFTNIDFNLRDLTFPCGPVHIAAVRELFVFAGECGVTLECLDEATFLELFRAEWVSSAPSLLSAFKYPSPPVTRNVEATDPQVIPDSPPHDPETPSPLPQQPADLTTSPFDPTFPLKISFINTAQTLPKEHRNKWWIHSKILLRLFPRDEGNQGEVAVEDPVSFRLYFGLPKGVFDFLTDDATSNNGYSFQDVHVNFTSSQVNDSDVQHVKYVTTDRNEMELTLSNCCRWFPRDGRLRSFDFVLPAHFLPFMRLQINQCDHVVINYFDDKVFNQVTSVTLSEHFLQINEPWTNQMLQYFQNSSPGKLRELSLPLPIYFSIGMVTAITAFLREKGSEVTVTFTNIALKLGDEAFQALSPSEVSAVNDLLIAAGEQKVRLGRLDSGAMEELLRPSWAVESSALRKTLKK